jgi:hypothetical protein
MALSYPADVGGARTPDRTVRGTVETVVALLSWSFSAMTLDRADRLTCVGRASTRGRP